MRTFLLGTRMTFNIKTGFFKWLVCATMLIPCFSFSQVNESDPPQFVVVGIEVAGKKVTSTAGVGADFRPIPPGDVSDDSSKSPSATNNGKEANLLSTATSRVFKTFAINDPVKDASIRTPPETVLILRSLNGSIVRIEADSYLTAWAVHRAGERYVLNSGTVEFEITKPLGVFQIGAGNFRTVAHDAKLHIQTLPNQGAEIKALRGKARVELASTLGIADMPLDSNGSRKNWFVRVSQPIDAATNSDFDAKKFAPIKFTSGAEAMAFFKDSQNRATAAEDEDQLSEALLNQSIVLMSMRKNRDALEPMKKRLSITVGNLFAQYDTLQRIAEIFISLDEDQNALSCLAQALKIALGPFNPGLSGESSAIHKSLGALNRRIGDEAAAARYERLWLAADGLRRAMQPYEPAKTVDTGNIKYPKKMRQWNLSGSVLIDGIVDTDGALKDVTIARSIHPAFELAVVKNSMSVRFSPARSNGVAIAIPSRNPYSFKLTSSVPAPPDVPVAFRFPAVNTRAAADAQYDFPPQISIVSLPVYPRELVMRSVTGSAQVTVELDALGAVKDVTIIEATHPEFGAATKAMFENWTFAPAIKAGRAIGVKFRFERSFELNERDNGISDETKEALYRLKSKPEEIYEINALDTSPKALYKPQAADPRKTLASPATVDIVQIEFIIDREGGVQLPRIVSATNMDLAWSVATVLPRWLFDIPKVNGKAVFARKEMLFEFR